MLLPRPKQLWPRAPGSALACVACLSRGPSMNSDRDERKLHAAPSPLCKVELILRILENWREVHIKIIRTKGRREEDVRRGASA